MSAYFERILDSLAESPGDWDLRIAAIEGYLRRGKRDEALELVRESPDDLPIPADYQVQLHRLLTKGPDLAEAESVSQAVRRKENSHAKDDVQSQEEVTRDSKSRDPAKIEQPENSGESNLGIAALIASESATPIGPGSDGLSQRKSRRKKKETSSTGRAGGEKSKQGSPTKVPRIDRTRAQKRLEEYQGRLQLSSGELPGSARAPLSAPEGISAFSMALIVHAVLLFLIALITIHVPRPTPPQLIVSVPHEKETTLNITKITRPTEVIKPTAAAAQSVNVLTSISSSSLGLPDVETTDNLHVTSMMVGIQPEGRGMSFSTDAAEPSDINFFGISGGGKKIVFIVDATKFMLVDEKGGMAAYDKVKNEIGALLTELRRGTYFNILLYEGKNVVSFRSDMVPALPSNLRKAIEWMSPLNRDYASLGLGRDFGASVSVEPMEDAPIQPMDLAHYTRCIHKALSWHASAVFCITSGYRQMERSPTPEMLKMMAENPAVPGTPGQVDPREKATWDKAVAKTREWLREENAARKEKGISPKVVLNFNQLVRQITGATPPRRQGGTRGTPAGGGNLPPIPPITYSDIEDHIRYVVKKEFKEQGRDEPSIHMVLFLGEKEQVGAAEDHFRTIVRRNHGKLKVLRGLAALADVTSK